MVFRSQYSGIGFKGNAKMLVFYSRKGFCLNSTNRYIEGILISVSPSDGGQGTEGLR